MEKDELTREIKRNVDAWAAHVERGGRKLTEEEINNFLIETANGDRTSPIPDFNGFTLDQMLMMVNQPFEEGCPVQIRTLTQEQILEIPIMRQALHLMNALAEKEIKLTPKGYIPPKLSEELYEMGSHSWDTDWFNQKSEPRSKEVQTLRKALTGAGLIKVRSGKLSLTAKGTKLLSDHNALLRAILKYLFTDYDTSWLDAIEYKDSGNIGRAYSLWLLHHYADDDWCSYSPLYRGYFNAFSFLAGKSAYELRVFERLFRYIGLCDIDDYIHSDTHGLHTNQTIKKPIVEMMFSFEEPSQI